MSGYVKTFKDKGGDKNMNNKLMSFRIDDDKLFKKYKTIWTKICKIFSSALTKLRIYGDKVYSNFREIDVPEDGVECKSFTVISIDSLLVYDNNKYDLQIYLDNCAYKISENPMTDYLDDNLFETDEDLFFLILINGSYKYRITIGLIQVKEMIRLKVITVKNVWLVTIGFLIMGLNIKILFEMVVMTC